MKKTIKNIAILSGMAASIYTLAADPFVWYFGIGVQYAINLAVILLVLPALIVLLIKVNPGLSRFFNE